MPRIGRDSRRLSACLAACTAVVAGSLVGARGNAAPLKLPEAPYTYTVIDQDLGAALQEFGSNLGVKVNISPDVKGRIQGRVPESKPQAFLDRLTTAYNLEWYYDGGVLYVTPAKENRTQLLVLSPVGYDTLKGALDALQISDARFPIRPAPSKGVVMVSGPPRYVALVEQALAGLVAEEQARPKSPPPPPAQGAAGKEPPAPKVTVLTVFRGSQTTILRDGRPERVTGPESDAPARSGPQPAANLIQPVLPAGGFGPTGSLVPAGTPGTGPGVAPGGTVLP